MAEEVVKAKPTFAEIGGSGLRRWSGYVNEEFLQQLEGKRGLQVFREMSENDPTLRAALVAIDLLVRQVRWQVKPASADQKDLDAKELVEQCMHDMYQSWDDFISEAMSMLVYGFSLHEKTYKRRQGKQSKREMSSSYDDKRIGWKGFPIRSQETIDRWEFEEHGYLKGCWQIAPPDFKEVHIPVDRFLLFRTSSYKNNPEGKSVLRGAYRPWFYKRRIEEIEAIGIERDLSGLPMMRVDPSLLSPDAEPAERAVLTAYKEMIKNVRRDSQEGVILPAQYDQQGNPLFVLELLSSSGSRAQDTSQIIDRLDHQIARSLLADFILLGKASHGSFALSDDKTSLFHKTIQVWLGIIADTINEQAVPELLAVNGYDVDEYPQLVHGHVENRTATEIASFLQQLASSGAPVWPNDGLMAEVMAEAKLPWTPMDALAHSGDANRVLEQQREADERAKQMPQQGQLDVGEHGETGQDRKRGKGERESK